MATCAHTPRVVTGEDFAMVERFNGRVGAEVPGITIHSHRALEQLLRGFDAAYDARRQRVLDGGTPDQGSSPNASKPSASSPMPSCIAEQVRAVPPAHASSLKPPRRSRDRTIRGKSVSFG
jgi:hypothetical protein